MASEQNIISWFKSLFQKTNIDSDQELKKYNQHGGNSYKSKTDIIDGEVVNYKVGQAQNTSQAIADLNKEQLSILTYNLTQIQSLLCFHLKAINSKCDAILLDNLIDLWNEDDSKFSCSRDEFMNAVGFGFGQYLVDTFGMKWKIVNDEYGEDYATMIENSTLINYPLSSVDKAIREKRVGSLNSISLLDKKAIAELKSGK